MNFELDEQQRDFASAIDAALGAGDLPATVRAWSEGDTGPGRKVWSTLADLGVTALMVPEEHDGIGRSSGRSRGRLRADGLLVRSRAGHRIRRCGAGFTGRR